MEKTGPTAFCEYLCKIGSDSFKGRPDGGHDDGQIDWWVLAMNTGDGFFSVDDNVTEPDPWTLIRSKWYLKAVYTYEIPISRDKYVLRHWSPASPREPHTCAPRALSEPWKHACEMKTSLSLITDTPVQHVKKSLKSLFGRLGTRRLSLIHAHPCSSFKKSYIHIRTSCGKINARKRSMTIKLKINHVYHSAFLLQHFFSMSGHRLPVKF